MSVPRSLLAGAIVAVFALTGCSAGDPEEESPAPSESAGDSADSALEGLPDVVAVVNDEEIGLEEFTSAYENQLQQATAAQQQTGQAVDPEQLKQQVADLLVNNRLLTQAAAEAGIEAKTDDIETVLQEVADQSGLGSVDAVYEAFADQGMSEDDVREDAADQYELEQYIEANTDVTPPGDKELRAQYDTLVEQAKTQGSEESIPPFDEVKEQLADQAVTDEQNAATEEILAQLREDGDVEVNL
ncbi:SurA N-terminal domain-containing protein [Microbacterium halotolerans]|uniref:SurA N-terminal domain-containing protein n=1 Tax=Microbacterium halotolerans TaxID=246613 RepID=UPI000E6AD438|nr:SurA N-terminal domain-containing protein [Microbacterium halotolerans]